MGGWGQLLHTAREVPQSRGSSIERPTLVFSIFREAMPMMAAYIDDNGRRRVDPHDMHQLVASFFQDDVQNSVHECDDLLKAIDRVRRGEETEWDVTGNAHVVTLRHSGAVIENLWDESLGTATLSLDSLQACVLIWKDFLLATE